MTRNGVLSFASVLFLGALLTMNGCNLASDDGNSLTAPASSAAVFFHASPDASETAIMLDDQKLNTTFVYKTYTGYLPLIPPGTRRLKFVSQTSSATLIDTSFNFLASKPYSVLFVNKTPVLGSPKQALLIDDSGSLVAKENTLIRLVHLSPDSPPVDARVLEAGVTLASGQSYKQASPFKELATRSYTVEIRQTSDNKLLLTVNLPIPIGGTFQTIYFVGFSVLPVGNTNGLSSKVVN
jgi:Domain of unknown function (DUF4397)